MSKVNTGNLSTIPGQPSAARLLQHLKAVDKMVAQKEEAFKRMEIDERGTPAEEITPVFKAKKAMQQREIQRLREGQKYWKRKYEEELARLKQGGAREDDLTPYEIPPDPLYGVGISPTITPDDLGLFRREPYSDDFPVPQPNGPTPSDRECGVPGPSQRRAWINHQWEQYWIDLDRSKQDYARDLDHYQVEMYFWEQRRRKTLSQGKPFTGRKPPEPRRWSPVAPSCPPPIDDQEL